MFAFHFVCHSSIIRFCALQLSKHIIGCVNVLFAWALEVVVYLDANLVCSCCTAHNPVCLRSSCYSKNLSFALVAGFLHSSGFVSNLQFCR